MKYTGIDAPPPPAIRATLADMAEVLESEIATLESGLDAAFDHLSTARMAIAAPWSTDRPVQEMDELAELATSVLGTDHPCVAALRIEMGAPTESATDPAKVLRDLQRKCTTHMGAMMSALQVRDSLRQRYDHLDAALGAAQEAPDADLGTLAPVLAAQGTGLAEAVGTALDTLHQRAEAIVIAVEQVVDGARSDDRSPLGIHDALVDSAGSAPTANLAGADGRQIFAGLRRRTLPNTGHFILQARLANVQGAMDAVNYGVPALHATCSRVLIASDAVPAAVEGIDPESPLLTQLWDSYTVDDERDIHARLLQRRAA